MATPVYELVISQPNEAYYALCDRKEDHQAWGKELGEAMKQASGEPVVFCYSLNPKAWGFSVIKYPDLETQAKAAVIRKAKRVLRYFDSVSYLGYVPDDWKALTKALGVFHTNAPDAE